MAARLNPRHQQMVRDKIQASKLIEVLQDHAMGLSDDIKPTRLKAIEILLKKSVPDIQSIELTGDPEAPVSVAVRWKKSETNQNT